MPAHIMGDVYRLSELKRSLKELARDHGRRCAITVARAVAPLLTELMAGAYDSGQTIFGEARPTGVEGNSLSLWSTGKSRSAMRWVQTGTIVRAALSETYQKYLIGKYKIMPSGNQELPFRWQNLILDKANEVIEEFVDAGNGLGRAR